MRVLKVLACLCTLLGFTIQEGRSAQESKYYLKKFNWLLGGWRIEAKNGYLIESWSYVNDSTFQGSSYKVTLQGDTIPLEKIQLIYRNNSYSYVPTTADQNSQQPVIFTISDFDKHMFIAENPEHDFPQRIIYELKNVDELYAKIDGNIDDHYDKEEYYMYRVQ